MKKPLTISLVIPAYNEESYIGACLQSACNQTVPFDQIIVVDNNSTDATARIAARFPGVTVIRERQQGPAFSRDAGFNAAKSDIIARGDGDSIFDRDWVARVKGIFTADVELAAVSGSVTYREIGAAQVCSAIDRRIRNYLSRRMAAVHEQFLFGVNMAIRRDAWRAVRADICHERGLHEDLDLAVHLTAAGRKVTYEPQLHVSIVQRQGSATPREFYRYAVSNITVFRHHTLYSVRYVRRVTAIVICLYPFIFALSRGYNPASGRFSLVYFLGNTRPARVSPVSESL